MKVKKMRKIIKSILTITAFTICVISLAIISSAEKYEDFIYEVSGNGVIITAYTGNDTFVYIPDQIDGMDVIAIGSRAFYYDDDNWLEKDKDRIKLNNSKKNCPKIKNIRLPNRLQMIAEDAFQDCTSLENLVLPNSLGVIGTSQMYYGYIVQGCKNLKNIVMGDNIYEINSNTFSYGRYEGFYDLNSLRKISLYAKHLYSAHSHESCPLNDVYFRSDYSTEGGFRQGISYHFATKENMDKCYDENYGTYDVDVVPVSKSHYKVTFDANGGQIPQIKDSYIDYNNELVWRIGSYAKKTTVWTLKGQQVSEEIRPIKEDCTFVGWYDNKECKGEPWDFVLDTVSKSMTLYAKWKPTEYKVTFNADGGKCDTKTGMYSFGLAMKSLPEAKRDGFDFVGWYTRKGANGDRCTEKSEMPKNNITLYAAWIKKGTKLKVVLDPNGGSCSKNSVSYKFNKKMSTLPTPTYKGKKFMGWNTQEDGKGVTYTKDSIMDVPTLTLYAIWSVGKYNIILDANGGKVSNKDISLKYNEVIGKVNNPKRTNFEFQGWYYENGKKFSPRDKMPAKDITLIAKWKGFEYMIFFDAGKGKCSKTSETAYCGDKVGELPVPKRTGYIFMGWYDEDNVLYTENSEMPSEDITLYAEWKKVSEYASEVSIDKTDVTLGVGMTFKPKVTTTPKYTLDEFTWETSNIKIASVDENGLITAKSKGTATITVITSKNKKATIKVKVETPVKKLISPYTERKLKIGQKIILKISYFGYAGQLSYISDNTNVVKVDKNGEITAVGKGTAFITVKAYNGVSVKVKLKVS